MNEISIIGLDLAKNVFQIPGAGPDGKVALRKKLNRGRLLEFFAQATPLRGRDGSLRQRTLLGTGDQQIGP